MAEYSKDPLRPVRDFLYQVRDGKRKVTILEKRILLRQDAMETIGSDALDAEIAELQQQAEVASGAYDLALISVSDMISRLDDINEQMVLTLRYIDTISDWYVVAEKMGMTKAAVQKLHGRALPKLQRILEQADKNTAQSIASDDEKRIQQSVEADASHFSPDNQESFLCRRALYGESEELYEDDKRRAVL